MFIYDAADNLFYKDRQSVASRDDEIVIEYGHACSASRRRKIRGGTAASETAGEEANS